MYKLLIADDEPWVAYRLEQLVDYEALGFSVIGIATDGQEALARCLAEKPDVLLSDIRMPGLDGIQLLQALREAGLPTEVALISGYAEFSYAQDALRLGAFDYLVKRVTAEQLTDMLTRLRERLSARAYGIDTVFALLDEDSALSIDQWLTETRHDFRFALYRFCTFDALPGEYPGFFRAHRDRGFAYVMLRTGKEKMSALVGYADDAALSELALPGGVRAGFSQPAGAGAGFATLFRQSDIAYHTARFHGWGAPCVYAEDGPAREGVQSLLADLDAALAEGNRARGSVLLSAIEKELLAENIAQIALCCQRIADILARHQIDVSDAIGGMSYLRLAQHFASLGEVFDLLQGALEEPKPDEPFVWDEILQTIDGAFATDLRIADLARRFHFSVNYFSTLFHKHTGQTFTQYITQRRLAHAKRLLTDGALSLQDVADQSGYNDYFHFNKAFKKHVGLTPGQYKRQVCG